MKKTLSMAIAVWAVASLSFGANVIHATFEGEPTDPGPPSGFNIYGHELMDRGVTDQQSYEGEQCGYIVADFGMDTWGVIMLSDFGEWDLRGATLSVALQANQSFTDKQPIIGFKLVDADGTGYRTDLAELGAADKSWVTFAQSVNDLVPDEDKGDEPGLDLANIVQYGVILFDRQDMDKMVTFYIDDIKATK
jgi:hypothetical protein